MKKIALITMCLTISLSVFAHVDWTRTNMADPDMYALYQFDEHDSEPGMKQFAADGISQDYALVIGQASAETVHIVHNFPEEIFAPHSAQFLSTQVLQTQTEVHGTEGDVTIEFWFKWPEDLTFSSIDIGFRSSAKIRITRDFFDPSKDQFGVQTVHGDFVSAPGFTNWADVGEEEGGLGIWRHVGLTIHSTGMHFNEAIQHDVYNDGSIGRIYLNGHATGSHPHTFDLSGISIHDHSRIIINNLAGSVFIDEVTLWKKDWSENGAVSNPFRDGRGVGPAQSNVEYWELMQ